MHVYVGGSPTMERLTDKMLSLIDKMIGHEETFMLGDDPGAPQLVAGYLASVGYDKVEIYHVDEVDRVDGWTYNKIEGEREDRPHDTAILMKCEKVVMLCDEGCDEANAVISMHAIALGLPLLVYNEEAGEFKMYAPAYEVEIEDGEEDQAG